MIVVQERLVMRDSGRQKDRRVCSVFHKDLEIVRNSVYPFYVNLSDYSGV